MPNSLLPVCSSSSGHRWAKGPFCPVGGTVGLRIAEGFIENLESSHRHTSDLLGPEDPHLETGC